MGGTSMALTSRAFPSRPRTAATRQPGAKWNWQPGSQKLEVPLQSTWLKRTTELSEELPPAQRRWLPARERLTVQGSPLGGLVRASGAEGRRHAGSADHFQVQLTTESEAQVKAWQSRWIIYQPHWQLAPGLMEALQATYLKRSWQVSHTLPPHEKLYIRPHERLRLGTAGLPAPEGHLQVDLEPVELERLRATEPRSPLCRYFSADPLRLQQELETCFSDARFGPASLATRAGTGAGALVGLLLPHGAFCNSGFVAAHGYQLLADSLTGPLDLAVLIGNNHAAWNRVALCDQDWATPLGVLEVDHRALKQLLCAVPGVPVQRQVHATEHSIENQLPFLQHLQLSGETRLRILPVGVGAVALSEAQQLANQLAALVRSVEHGHQVVVIGTTDFSHEGPSYGGRCMSVPEITRLTKEKDKPLLEAVRAMDVEKLLSLAQARSCTMCGAGAAAVLLLTCQALGASQCRQLRYLVNTEVTPCDSTTGFAAFALEKKERRDAGRPARSCFLI
ncbi:unnamed protein product [Durusdinium trenchii]|uniref:AmmeMemoRadiSam system protein B n=1 Tax=Durusdinium trenchii TaxID=1381693 RepID=A0ABP0KV76_9DINO